MIQRVLTILHSNSKEVVHKLRGIKEINSGSYYSQVYVWGRDLKLKLWRVADPCGSSEGFEKLLSGDTVDWHPTDEGKFLDESSPCVPFWERSCSQFWVGTDPLLTVVNVPTVVYFPDDRYWLPLARAASGVLLRRLMVDPRREGAWGIIPTVVRALIGLKQEKKEWWLALLDTPASSVEMA